ncbi:hypothetical protein GGTG_13567 [Gaeumannomyces tritici R3-111a-1]|uniref:Uncharacterized protein n=1 Tax=Gaeumannomyces tritici (strain R3-111a-1) TaxID=644352 RepID=J3PJ86_GAET3|nr:hypothetical protein GGTG_13567 [Gaeumannomyces tritici R3-111a-1]EJT68858.1 hypothetical protein GGTG_13567 [Gaeumannomyces tritici R3-111a-1]
MIANESGQAGVGRDMQPAAVLLRWQEVRCRNGGLRLGAAMHKFECASCRSKRPHENKLLRGVRAGTQCFPIHDPVGVAYPGKLVEFALPATAARLPLPHNKRCSRPQHQHDLVADPGEGCPMGGILPTLLFSVARAGWRKAT